MSSDEDVSTDVSESTSSTATDNFQQDLNYSFNHTIGQAANRVSLNDLTNGQATSRSSADRLWSPTDLFHLTAAERDPDSILAPLREFLKNYELRAPVEVEEAYTVAEAHGLTLQNNIHQKQYNNLWSIVHGCIVQWLTALLKLPATFTGVIATSPSAARHAVILAASKKKNLKRSETPLFYSRYKTSYLECIPQLLGVEEDSLRIGAEVAEFLDADAKAEGKAPICLFGTVGNDIGRVEDTTELAALARQHNVWLHVEGDSLPLLITKDPSLLLQRVADADSILFDAAKLLGFGQLTVPVLFFKREGPNAPESPPSIIESIIETQKVASPQLHLGLWFCMHYLGRSRLSSSVSRARAVIEILERRLAGLAHIKTLHLPAEENLQIAFRYIPNLSKALIEAFEPTPAPRGLKTSSSAVGLATVSARPEGAEPTAASSTASTITPSASTDSLSSSSAAVLPVAELPDEAEDRDIAVRATQLNEILPYLNTVNRQIMSDLVTSTGIIFEFDLLSVKDTEYVRFRPLVSPLFFTLTDEDVNKFADHLLIETELITSCIACRPFFQRAIARYPGFLSVKPDPPNLVGLGAVRFNPLEKMFKAGNPSLKEGPQMSDLVDDLNKSIVIRLNNEKHHIFYTAATEEGNTCIALHVDIAPLNRARAYSLALLLHQTASAVESEIKFNDKVGDVVRQSIKQVQAAIKKETEAKKSEQGFVRKIPIVGSVYNWWSPVKAEVKGRAFDLLTAQVEVKDSKLLPKAKITASASPPSSPTRTSKSPARRKPPQQEQKAPELTAHPSDQMDELD